MHGLSRQPTLVRSLDKELPLPYLTWLIIMRYINRNDRRHTVVVVVVRWGWIVMFEVSLSRAARWPKPGASSRASWTAQTSQPTMVNLVNNMVQTFIPLSRFR